MRSGRAPCLPVSSVSRLEPRRAVLRAGAWCSNGVVERLSRSALEAFALPRWKLSRCALGRVQLAPVFRRTRVASCGSTSDSARARAVACSHALAMEPSAHGSAGGGSAPPSEPNHFHASSLTSGNSVRARVNTVSHHGNDCQRISVSPPMRTSPPTKVIGTFATRPIATASCTPALPPFKKFVTVG